MAIKQSAIPAGFDVTCTIGRVEFHSLGEETVDQAAFRLIADHQAEGEYRYPKPNGGNIVVNVLYEEEQEKAA